MAIIGSSGVASLDTGRATHVPHRLCRAAAGRSRSQPGRSARKCLLKPVIPGRSRLCRSSPYRPVTPEVAGSSPVAPVKVLANRRIVLSEKTSDPGRLHRFCSPGDPKRPETGPKTVSG